METAIVGIVGAVIGILLSNVLRVYVDWRNRVERVRDIQTALRAEIRSHRRALEDFDVGNETDEVATRIEADMTFTPFVAREIDPPVFSAIVSDIHILPASVIDSVVVYYRQSRSLAAMADDMRGATYASLPGARKSQLYRDYVAMGRFALELADDALAAIDGSLSSATER